MRKIRDIICREKKLYMVFLLCLYSLCALCGCTKKEELILLTQDEEEMTDVSGKEQDTFGVSEGVGQDAFGITDGKAEGTSGVIAGNVRDVSAGSGVTTGSEGDSSAAYIVEEKKTIYVHVCGAVMSPGVYELPEGSRVYEAVRSAGGFTDDADESYVNQAQEIKDGGKLRIPTVEEVEEGGMPDGLTGLETGQEIQAESETQTSAGDGRVNINTASVEELCKIPGIGAARAAAVVSYREDHGRFESPEDIMKVTGIKEGTFEKIKDSISVK